MAVVSLVARVDAQVAQFESKFKSAGQTASAFEKQFSNTASSVAAHQERLNKAFASFSGDKIIRDATELAAAVDRVGGAAKLTAAEQLRVNTVVQEAIAKYQALGQAAPKALTDLEQATRRVVAATEPAQKTTSLFGQSLDTLQSKGSLSEKAMGALTGTFGKFTLAGVAVGIINKLGGELASFVERGSKLGPVQESFQRLSATVNQDSQVMLSSLRTATQSMVSDYDLMLSANKAVLLGLPATATEMGDLAQSARVLGKAMGLDTTQALDNLIVALGRSSPLILDNLGLTVKVGEANEQYAAKLGKSVSELTDAEKKLAFYTAAMEKAREKTLQLGEQTKTLGEIVFGVWTRVGNVVTSTVSVINKGVGAAISGVTNAASNIGTFFTNIYNNGVRATVGVSLFNRGLIEMSRTSQQAAKVIPIPPNYATQLDAIRLKVAALTKEQKEQIKAAELLGGDALKELLDRYKLTDVHLKVLNQTTKAATKTTKDFSAEASALVARVQRNDDAANKLTVTLARMRTNLQNMGLKAATDALAIQERQLKKTEQAWFDLQKVISGTNLKVVEGLDNLSSLPGKIDLKKLGVPEVALRTWDELLSKADKFAKALDFIGGFSGGKFGQIVDEIANIASAFDRASRAAAAFTKEGATTAEKALAVAEGIGAVAQATSGKSRGAAVAGGALAGAKVGAIAGPIGIGIGAAAGAIVGFIRTAGQGRKAVEEFAESFGGFDALRTKLNALGSEGERLWTTLTQGVGKNNPQQAQAAIQAISDALNGPANQAARAEAAIQRWGFSFEELGSKVQASRVSELGKSLLQDWEDLTFIGVDVNAIAEKMSDAWIDLGRKAIASGSELSASFRGPLEKLQEMGKLTDENGNSLLDLNEIKWAETMTQSTDRMIAAFKELGEVIRASVGGALDDVSARASSLGDFRSREGSRLDFEVQDDFGNTSPLGGDFSGGGGSQPIVTQVYLDGRQIAEATAPYTPSVLRRAGVQ